MTGKERITRSLNHQWPGGVAVDFGSTAVTGMHVTCVAELRRHYDLENRPVKVCEPYQMLGELEDDLLDALGVDTIGLPWLATIFGFRNENWKEFEAPWGQLLLVSEHFRTKKDTNGDLLIYPQGDTTAPPSGRMPTGGFLARRERPKVIIAGTTAYPFELDFDRFRSIADETDAWLVADISHIAGLVVAGEHQSPVPYCDLVMTTTHKTLRGPRGAAILVTERGLERDPGLGGRIDRAVIPGVQGGSHNATIAAIAVAAEEAMRPGFLEYIRRVRRNTGVLSSALAERGVPLVGGGTENRLILLDLSQKTDRFSTGSPGLGTQVAYAMDIPGLYANKNSVPDDPSSPFYPSGVRLGTPLVTTRGMGESEMRLIADWIGRVIEVIGVDPLPADRASQPAFMRKLRGRVESSEALHEICAEAAEVAARFPLFSWDELSVAEPCVAYRSA